MNLPGRHLKLRIEIDVISGNPSRYSVDAVNDVLQELVNRIDMRSGTIKQGRAITHRIDFEDTIVTVDVFRENLHPAMDQAEATNRSQNPS